MKVDVGNWNEMDWDVINPNLKRIVFTGEGVTCSLNSGPINADFKPRPHKHPQEQIAIILEGEGYFVVDGERHKVKPGSYVVVPPNVEHYLDSPGFDTYVVNLDIFAPRRDDMIKK